MYEKDKLNTYIFLKHYVFHQTEISIYFTKNENTKNLQTITNLMTLGKTKQSFAVISTYRHNFKRGQFSERNSATVVSNHAVIGA